MHSEMTYLRNINILIIVTVISTPYFCQRGNRSKHNFNNSAGIQGKLFLNFSLILLSTSTLRMHLKSQAANQLQNSVFE